MSNRCFAQGETLSLPYDADDDEADESYVMMMKMLSVGYLRRGCRVVCS